MKKLLALFLAVLMILSTFPVTAAAATTPANVNDAVIATRISTLRNFVNNNSYGYKYFTTTGSYCTTKDSGHGCSKCLTTNLIKANWIKNELGLLPNSDSLLPYPRWASPEIAAKFGKEGVLTSPAYSCVGFAMIAHWFIYAQKNTDNIAAEHIATINLSSSSVKTNLEKNAKLGDMLVFKDSLNSEDYDHAAIYTGCSTSGITVLDSNWGGSSGATCKMQEHTISYSSYNYVEISRATNYTASSVKVTGVSVSPTSASLTVGGTKSLTATVSPSNATNKAVTWSSTNTGVATVSSSGVVTAKAAGSATIKATTSDGGYTASCSVTVNPKTYTVSYDANGGSGAPSAQTKTAGVALKLSSTVPTRSGYTFKGWQVPDIAGTNGWVTTKPTSGTYETGYKYYTWGYECDHCRDYGYNYDVDYTFYVGDVKQDVINDVKANPSVYGTYTPSKLRYFWKIESTNKGDSYYPGQNGTTYNYFNADYIAEDGKTGTVSIYKTKYYFESVVYRQEAVTGKTYQPGDYYYEDSGVVLRAIWEKSTTPETYRIIYNDGGGDGEPDDQIKTQGVTLKLSSTIPTRSGYKFKYWQATDGTTYAPGDDYTKDEPTMLTAMWDMVIMWSISYDANGGSGAPAAQTKGKGVALKLSSKVPTRNGYTFKYWQATDGTTYAPGANYTKDEATTLKAIWEKNVAGNETEATIGNTTGKIGDAVTVSITLKNARALKSLALSDITYDTNALELISGEWKISDSLLSNVDKTKGAAVITFADNMDCNREIFHFTFLIKDEAKDGKYPIFCNITSKYKDGTTEKNYDISTITGSVIVTSVIKGDINGDDQVNSDDAIYLLYSTLLPDLYPINQNGDYDGNGEVNSDDAIYLLYYTLLPDLYPLH